MVVCVLVYPEDGEAASVVFLDVAAFKAAPYNAEDRRVIDAIDRALANEVGVSVSDDDWVTSTRDVHYVKPPCSVQASITIFLDT
jgi:hypothetical protein